MSNKEEETLEINKAAALANVFANIEKQFGKGSIISASSGTLPGVEFISTGSISLDDALGGGLARGRIVEAYGPESSGKTTLALTVVAQAMKAGGICAFIDAEHALDLSYASALGVDPEKLSISQPGSAEEALGILDLLVQSGTMDVIVIDSVAALVPAAELAGDVGDSHMGLQARLMGQTMRMITGKAAKTNTLVIFLNQLRMKIGVVFGNPEVTAGGNALKFYASQRLEIRSSKEKAPDGENITANLAKVKVVKNKVSPPFRETNLRIVFGKGIDIHNDLLNFAVGKGIIDKAGAWYSFQGDRIGQGEDNATDFLRDHPELYNKIFELCRTKD